VTDGRDAAAKGDFDHDHVEGEGPFCVAAGGRETPFAELFVCCCGADFAEVVLWVPCGGEELDLLEEAGAGVELACNGGEVNRGIKWEKRDQDFVVLRENCGPGVSGLGLGWTGGYLYPEQRTFLPFCLAYLTIF
jgi:hypothetical protein